MTAKKYRTKQILVNSAGPIRANGSNAITILNIGTVIAQIDSLLLNPGDSITDEGWPGEENHTNYTLSFPAGIDGQVLVFEKIYI